MKAKLTKKYILANRGCYSQKQTQELLKKFNSPISLKILVQDFPIPLKDRLWFLFIKCEIDLQIKIDLSFELAVIVSEIFNDKYPNDDRVDKCLQACRDYKAGKITVYELRMAADDADDAYDASDAAYDAAYDAVYNAATAAAYAAYNAYAAVAAYAAYAADAADGQYEQKIISKVIEFLKLD